MFLATATLAKLVFVMLLFALPLATVLTLFERRQSAYSQDWLGPQRAHFMRLFGRPFVLFGLFHPVADGLKSLFKESVEPRAAARGLYRVAPLIGFGVALVGLSFIPFGPDLVTRWGVVPLQVVRIDGGLLYVLAIGSLGVYGAALAGWASNNRYALLGGLRASAQSISYEVTLGLTVVGVIIVYGSTELSAIVEAQRGLLFGFLPNWGLFVQPVAAVLFFVAATAETKRGPFDLPEGESEIVGYFIEYSSMGFALFMLGEFLAVVMLAALFVTLFLGGWQAPWIMGEETVALGPWVLAGSWARPLVGVLVFSLKVLLVCLLQLQVRWTLPRFRYDQLMRLGWKTLLPLSLANIFVTALFVAWDPSNGRLAQLGLTLILLFVLVVVAGPRRVARPVPGR